MRELAASQPSTPPTYEQGAEDAAQKVDELQQYLEQLAMESTHTVADNAYTRAAYEAELCAQAIRALPLKEKAEVCEWSAPYQRGYSVVQDTQCGDIHAQPGARGFKFCPYCGKPIKIKGGGECGNALGR